MKWLFDMEVDSINTEVLDLNYVCKDAWDFMCELPDKSVQLIITSPPYNIGKEYETRTNINDYIYGLEYDIDEMIRILADNGSICWQVGNFIEDGEVFPLDIYFYNLFKMKGLKLRNRIIWHYGHGLHCKKRFSNRYETILWFTKSDNYTFNLDPVRIPSKYPNKKHYKGKKRGQLSGNPLGKNPEDVWEMTVCRLRDDWEHLVWDIPNVKNNHPEKVDHPCQFPIELVERCILALTNEGDVVYDPYAGVGSTIIGAIKNNRKAFGTEVKQKYVDVGLDRIKRFNSGELKTRPIYQEIYNPHKTNKNIV